MPSATTTRAAAGTRTRGRSPTRVNTAVGSASTLTRSSTASIAYARPRSFATHQRSPTSRKRQSWENSAIQVSTGLLPSTALLSALVLERHLDLGPIALDLAVLQLHVEL